MNRSLGSGGNPDQPPTKKHARFLFSLLSSKGCVVYLCVSWEDLRYSCSSTCGFKNQKMKNTFSCAFDSGPDLLWTYLPDSFHLSQPVNSLVLTLSPVIFFLPSSFFKQCPDVINVLIQSKECDFSINAEQMGGRCFNQMVQTTTIQLHQGHSR